MTSAYKALKNRQQQLDAAEAKALGTNQKTKPKKAEKKVSSKYKSIDQIRKEAMAEKKKLQEERKRTAAKKKATEYAKERKALEAKLKAMKAKYKKETY